MRVREAVASDLPVIRALFREYAQALGIDLSFQGFERELVVLPGEYASPAGALLLAEAGAEAIGCVGVRPLDADACELKRLFVRPGNRGAGAGRALAEAALAAARAAGYRRIRLDTLPSMGEAIPLYRDLGFREIEPYRFNPVEGTRFLELELSPARSC